MKRIVLGLLITAVGFFVAAVAHAGDVKFFDDGTVALLARINAGVREPSVPVLYNGVQVDDPGTVGEDVFNVVDIFDHVPIPNTASFPLTWSDIVANMFLRATYQKPDLTTAHLGTSVLAAPSYRTPGGTAVDFHFPPAVERAEVTTGAPQRVQVVVTGNFGEAATLSSIRTYPDPAIGRSESRVTVRFEVNQDIALDGSALGKDALRLLTVSSMWADSQTYDADVLRYEDAAGIIRTLRMGSVQGRGAHLIADGTALGSWFELIKEPGSTWYPDSPSVRIDIMDTPDFSGRLGIQGSLAESTNPNDDSLSVWVEWIDAPSTVPAGTTINLQFRITATPPAAVLACVGDCDNSGDATVNEITTLVNIALGNAQPSLSC